MNIKKFSHYLKETTLSRQWDNFTSKDRVAAIISASHHERSPEENLHNTRELAQEVRRLGYGFVYATGHYVESDPDGHKVPVEETVLIITGKSPDNGRLKGYLRGWCRSIPQEAAIYKPEGGDHVILITPSDETDIGTFNPNRVGDMMTRLRGRGQRSFVFEGAYYQMTFFEALAAKVRAR